jgi:hypothetical protein
MNPGADRTPQGRAQNGGIYEVTNQQRVDYPGVPDGFYRMKIDGKKRKYNHGHPSRGNEPFCLVWVGIVYSYGFFLTRRGK